MRCYVTYRCNMSCSYCNDGLGNKYPEKKVDRELSAEEWGKVFKIIRRVTPFVMITGGEPTVRGDIGQITLAAKNAGLWPIALCTNGLNLDEHLDILDHIDFLMVSLDTLDSEKADEIMGVPGAHRRILSNLERAAKLQKKHGFSLHVIATITADRIDDTHQVLDWAHARNIGFAPQPANDRGVPFPGLEGNPKYTALIDRIIRLKKSGHKIAGTLAYLGGLREFSRYRCDPMLLGRLKPNGEHVYPCSIRYQTSKSLLDTGDYHRLLKDCRIHHGLDDCDKSCKEGCYMEMSLLVRKPWHGVWDAWIMGVMRPWRDFLLSRTR
jgi:MoaA/NifB/PqqE/SkfB family radical SAM enzyme